MGVLSISILIGVVLGLSHWLYNQKKKAKHG